MLACQLALITKYKHILNLPGICFKKTKPDLAGHRERLLYNIMSIHPADRATSRPTQHRSNINFSCFFSARHHRKLNIFGSKQYEGVTFGVQITWGEDCSLVSYMKSIKRFTHTHTQMHTFNDRATCLSHGGVLQNCSVLSGTKAAVPGHRTGKSTSTRAQWHGVNLDKLQPDGGRTWREKKGRFIYNNNKKSAEKKSDYSNRGSDYKKQAEAGRIWQK